MHNKKLLYQLSLYILPIIICVFALFPILWGLSTSFKPNSQTFVQPPRWIPETFTIEHYKKVISDPKMMGYFANSTIIASLSTAIALVIGILGAYGFSRYKFPGNRTLLYSILFVRILPRISLIIPFFIILKNLYIYNTYPGIVLVYLMVTMPLSIWLLKGFFDGIPYEIEEAAVVDGCSSLGVLWKIVIPLSLPAIASVGMYVFIMAWNEFLFALTMTQGSALRPISVGLAFFIDENGVQWGELMAASILMSIPAIFVFSLFQKNLIKGLGEGAVKG